LLAIAENLKEYTFRYDNMEGCVASNGNPGGCIWKLKLDEEMKGPVFVYYEIKNFYQNHRKYFKSKSPDQLRGTILDDNSISDCDPVTYNRDLYITKSITGVNLDPNKIAHPCGSMARSIFNDSYLLLKDSTTEVPISSSGIAWPQDKLYKYKLPSDTSNVWYNVTDGRDGDNK
jgi:hypothetical protein